jgi:hypothetical protein
VRIVPVGIQTPVERGTADEVGPGDGSLGVELGATTACRLGLGTALAVGFGPTIAGAKNAPPNATTATTAAAANVVLKMDRVLHGPNTTR